MRKLFIILVLGAMTTASALAQGITTFGFDFNGNPPPHLKGIPASGAILTNDLFSAIVYLDNTEPSGGVLLQKQGDGSFTPIFTLNLVYASYSGVGAAEDYEGSWQLNETQIQQLEAGQWYAQVNYGDTTYLGELSPVPVPEPTSRILFAGGLCLMSATCYRRRISASLNPQRATA